MLLLSLPPPQIITPLVPTTAATASSPVSTNRSSNSSLSRRKTLSLLTSSLAFSLLPTQISRADGRDESQQEEERVVQIFQVLSLSQSLLSYLFYLHEPKYDIMADAHYFRRHRPRLCSSKFWNCNQKEDRITRSSSLSLRRLQLVQ